MVKWMGPLLVFLGIAYPYIMYGGDCGRRKLRSWNWLHHLGYEDDQGRICEGKMGRIREEYKGRRKEQEKGSLQASFRGIRREGNGRDLLAFGVRLSEGNG
jgi:hypothetical protein